MKRLDHRGRLFGSIDRFLQGVDVVENELLDPASMPEPFREVLLDYLDTLERYRLLTYGQQIVRAVDELVRPPASVRRRARPDADVAGEQVGGQDGGDWYYCNLAIHIVNYAQGVYENFDGEGDFELNAVDLTTVHRAKGLEWPVVFVPSMTAGYRWR